LFHTIDSILRGEDLFDLVGFGEASLSLIFSCAERPDLFI